MLSEWEDYDDEMLSEWEDYDEEDMSDEEAGWGQPGTDTEPDLEPTPAFQDDDDMGILDVSDSEPEPGDMSSDLESEPEHEGCTSEPEAEPYTSEPESKRRRL